MLVREDGEIYKIVQRNDGKYEIVKNNSTACILCGAFLWKRVDPFASLVQATIYLRQNIDKMI